LWNEFEKDEPGISDKVWNPVYPKECPSILRKYAPWQLVKGKDSSCLCTNCEGTNTVKRSARGAIKAIAPIVNNLCQVIEENNVDDDNQIESDNSDSDSDSESGVEVELEGDVDSGAESESEVDSYGSDEDAYDDSSVCDGNEHKEDV